MTIPPTRLHGLLAFAAMLLAATTLVSAQTPPTVVGMGDSIGEGVQSGDASARTQRFSYLNWLAFKIGAPFPLPWIWSGPFGVVGETNRRSRIFPETSGLNLAVSGADVDVLLNKAADAITEAQIDSETDLVLFPRLGSQIQIVESMAPPPDFIVCWIGNNDVLRAAISWSRLDASQMTPVVEFTNRFSEIADRLGALGSKVVFANIPDVASIAFLFDAQDLQRFLGSDFGLAGHFTSVVAMLLVKLGLESGSIFMDPNFVLDPAEIDDIQARVEEFNSVIAQAASSIGAPVVDVNAIFRSLEANPLEVAGVPLSGRFLGGLFSLDGVHPSNLTHAVVADFFIETLNTHYQTAFPRLSEEELFSTFLFDPHIDKDGDGRVPGRPLAGLLETLSPFLGFSGDQDDAIPTTHLERTPAEQTERLHRAYRQRTRPLQKLSTSQREAIRRALELVFWSRPSPVGSEH